MTKHRRNILKRIGAAVLCAAFVLPVAIPVEAYARAAAGPVRTQNLSVRAVENSRYRLRKKLGLTSAQNLNEFLMHIDSQESGPKDDEVQDPDL